MLHTLQINTLPGFKVGSLDGLAVPVPGIQRIAGTALLTALAGRGHVQAGKGRADINNPRAPLFQTRRRVCALMAAALAGGLLWHFLFE